MLAIGTALLVILMLARLMWDRRRHPEVSKFINGSRGPHGFRRNRER
jgi:hypothetical protein